MKRVFAPILQYGKQVFITALICAGRVGSVIVAELDSMKITEQIDTMEVSQTNPFKFLIITRILAATFILPLLIIFGDAVCCLVRLIIEYLKDDASFVLYFNKVFKAIVFTSTETK